ncbi:MAG: hypothetical protein ABIT96_03160 [Ferruginibacter sp.]
METNILLPEIKTDAAIKALLQTQPEKCTIVHCRLATEEEVFVRVWPQVVLVEDNGRRRKLIHCFNISVMPLWTLMEPRAGFVRFTLVFEGLGKSCDSFHLLEDIPEPGGFYSPVISRNKTDVYETIVISE